MKLIILFIFCLFAGKCLKHDCFIQIRELVSINLINMNNEAYPGSKLHKFIKIEIIIYWIPSEGKVQFTQSVLLQRCKCVSVTRFTTKVVNKWKHSRVAALQKKLYCKRFEQFLAPEDVAIICSVFSDKV